MRFVLGHWSANWPVLVIYAAVAGAHLTGLRRLMSDGDPADPADPPAGRRAMIREAAVFQAGLLLALLVIVSPLGYWSRIYMWVRALDDLTLAFVAPGLIVLGAPWSALARCLGRPAPGASDATGRRRWWLRWPVAAVVVFNVIWLGGHLTVVFDRVPVNSAAAAAEYVLYLGGGILFWLQLIGSRPWSPAIPPLRRAALLGATVAADTVLGMVLTFGSSVVYPGYANQWHHVMTVLDDQQLSGAILWMGILPPVIAAAVAALNRWLNDEDSAALSAGMDRLLAQPDRDGRHPAWPSRPRFR
jgi:cytochrome c oxidase assembly factor CtaG